MDLRLRFPFRLVWVVISIAPLCASGCGLLGEAGAGALAGGEAAAVAARAGAAGAAEAALARAGAAGAADAALARAGAAGAADAALARGGVAADAAAVRGGMAGAARAGAPDAAAAEFGARVGSEAEAAGGRAAAGRAAAPESMPPIERAYRARGGAVTDELLESAKRSRGSEPEVGWAKHFDQDGVYRGNSEFTRSEVRHFDDQGNFTGREIRSPAGSDIVDRDLRPSGKTVVQQGKTLAFDARDMYKGYSERVGDQIRGFDRDNVFTGHSEVYPWPSSYTPPALSLIAAAPFRRSADVTVTGLRFFVGTHPAAGCQAAFVQSLPFAAGRPVYVQVDSRIQEEATVPLNLPFQLVIEEDGVAPFSVAMSQAIKPGWRTACSWTAAFSLTAQDAGRTMSVRLIYAGRELAQTALLVTR